MKAHITNLGLENFRVFKDKTHFEFAPITILTGTNSSGKSSLISAMEMLQGFDIQTELNSRHGLSEYEFPTILKDISFLKLSKFAQSKGDFTNLESTKGKNKGVAFSFPGLIKGLDTVYCHLTLRYVGKSNEIGYENGELKQLLIETFEQNNKEISTIELFKIDFASKFNNVTINWKYFYKYYKINAEHIINKPKKTSEGDDKESRSLAKLLDTNKYRALLNDFLIYDAMSFT